jgi:hypothetical protein
MIAGLDKAGQSLPRFWAQAGLAEADCIETYPQRIVSD